MLSLFPPDLLEKSARLLKRCRDRGLTLSTAESCTGGLIAGTLTEIAGSSDVVDRGFVTYSNIAKNQLLGVPEALIAKHGAVSVEVAEAMAEGALAHSTADIAVSATGIAGPGGATETKPVGLVYIGGARRGGTPRAERHIFDGDRASVRLQSVRAAFELAEVLLESTDG